MKTPKQKEKDRLKKIRLEARAIKPKKIKHGFLAVRRKCDNLFSLYIRLVRDKDKPCITC